MRIIFILAVVLTTSCSKTNHSVKLNFQKDLIPEGIAIDPVSQKVYLNSLFKNKIVRSNLDGTQPEVFIESNQYGYLSGFGMTIKGDTLFALGNSHTDPDNQSILLLLNVSTGQLINTYLLKNLDKSYLNDLAVDHNGNFYITDSEHSAIYTQNKKNGHLEIHFSNPEIQHPNGITVSDNGQYLYIASMKSGIRILDIATKKLINFPNDHKGIDGMKFYKNTLICIVNARRDPEKNGIFQFTLNKSGTKITGQSKLESFENPTDIPTTFAIHKNHMYYVADSQMDMFDETSDQIIDTSKLEDYRLIRLNLNP